MYRDRSRKRRRSSRHLPSKNDFKRPGLLNARISGVWKIPEDSNWFLVNTGILPGQFCMEQDSICWPKGLPPRNLPDQRKWKVRYRETTLERQGVGIRMDSRSARRVHIAARTGKPPQCLEVYWVELGRTGSITATEANCRLIA